MNRRFEYGFARIKDLDVKTSLDGKGKVGVHEVRLDGRSLKPTPRFWNSLHLRFGFTSNIFRYFRHDEVFNRISEVAPNDRIRWCVEAGEKGEKLLAVSNPAAPVIQHDDLLGLLSRYETEETCYSDGILTSRHSPRLGDTFSIAGDDFQNKFVIDTPIDGFGRPAVYLSLLRLICSNGAVGQAPAFRSEVNVGKGGDAVEYALVRVLDGFNNEEGFAAMRQRFESAATSWTSVNEVNRFHKLLVAMHHRRETVRRSGAAKTPSQTGGDGASEGDGDSSLLAAYRRMVGDLPQMYGLANLDALSVKRQRTLPAACKVYDMLNFASEVATHRANPTGSRALQAFIGELISNEFDLEGTVDHFSDWQDFFIGHDATASTLAAMQRRT